jgi:hypothetical protein
MCYSGLLGEQSFEAKLAFWTKTKQATKTEPHMQRGERTANQDGEKIRILARRGRTLCRRLGGENLRIDKTNGGQKSRLKLATRMRQWFKRDQKTQRDLRQKGKLKQQPQKYQRSFAHTKEWRQTSGRGKTEKGDRSLATRID